MNMISRLTLACAALGFFAVPATAHAIEVQCMDRTGSCSLSNEPQDSYSCSCESGAADGGGGTEDWIDFSEKELMAECLVILANDCAAVGETDDPGMTTGMGGDTGGGSTGAGDTAGGTSSAGDDSGGATSGSASGSGDGTAAGGDDGPAATSGAATGDSGGETGGGADGGGDDDKGCSIGSRDAAPATAMAAFALFGLVGWRRRRHVG
jgi:MYXO-CTERM domain-containing protein